MRDGLLGLLVIIVGLAGHWVGSRRPRRRLYSNTLPSRSVIPPGANPLPGDDECVRLGHRQLAWTEQIDRLPTGGTRSQVTEATCRDCGRPQAQIRLVYPPERALTVRSDRPSRVQEAAGHSDATSP